MPLPITVDLHYVVEYLDAYGDILDTEVWYEADEARAAMLDPVGTGEVERRIGVRRDLWQGDYLIDREYYYPG